MIWRGREIELDTFKEKEYNLIIPSFGLCVTTEMFQFVDSLPNELPELIETKNLKMKSFYLDNVEFEVDEVLSLLKKAQTHSEKTIGDACPEEFRDEIIKRYREITPMTANDVLSFSNAEQRMVAIKHFGMEDLLNNFKHEVIDKQTLKKVNHRWKVGESGLTPYTEEIEDTYELIKVQMRGTRRWGNEVVVDIYGIRCKCTTTGREYFIYSPPKKEASNSWSNDEVHYTDVIEAIAATLETNVRPEAAEYFMRQGDVVLAVIKKGYENNWKGSKRTLTVDEYKTKLYSET